MTRTAEYWLSTHRHSITCLTSFVVDLIIHVQQPFRGCVNAGLATSRNPDPYLACFSRVLTGICGALCHCHVIQWAVRELAKRPRRNLRKPGSQGADGVDLDKQKAEISPGDVIFLRECSPYPWPATAPLSYASPRLGPSGTAKTSLKV